MAVTQGTVLSKISSKLSALTENKYSLSSRMESMDDGRTRSSDGNYHRSHYGMAPEVGADPPHHVDWLGKYLEQLA